MDELQWICSPALVYWMFRKAFQTWYEILLKESVIKVILDNLLTVFPHLSNCSWENWHTHWQPFRRAWKRWANSACAKQRVYAAATHRVQPQRDNMKGKKREHKWQLQLLLVTLVSFSSLLPSTPSQPKGEKKQLANAVVWQTGGLCVVKHRVVICFAVRDKVDTGYQNPAGIVLQKRTKQKCVLWEDEH